LVAALVAFLCPDLFCENLARLLEQLPPPRRSKDGADSSAVTSFRRDPRIGSALL
jgi:hypothetical protein